MAESDRKCPTCGRTFGPDVVFLFCPIDGAPLVRGSMTSLGDGTTDPYLGLKLLGQIEIKRLAGVGSMARVYRAFQHGVDREVAVKVLHRELSSNQEIVERFHREARVASKVAHPNVVQVLLTAQLPQDTPQVGGELVLVMEYLEGMSLLSALGASGGALSLPRAMHIALQICDAVGEAHTLGVVHRDLKPENVMLVKRGDDPDFVKVLDFGLARLSTRDASYATRAGAIFGSPRYISPEGAQGLPVGPPADVYAIATLIYQCLAGRTPFEADTPVGYLLAHANEPAPRLNTHSRSSYVPDPIVDVLDQALAKRPEDRPADAHQLARQLFEAARRSGLLSEALLSGPSWGGGRGSVAGVLASLARTHAMNLGPSARVEMGTPLSTGTLAGNLDEPPPSAAPRATRPPVDPGETPRPSLSRPPTLPPQPLPTRPPMDLAFEPPTGGVSPTLFDEPLPAPSASRDDAEMNLLSQPGLSQPGLSQPGLSQPPRPTVPPADNGPPLAVSEAPPPVASAPQPTSSTAAPTAPPSEPRLADASISGYNINPLRSRSHLTTALLVVACFVGGAGLAAVGAARLGILPARAAVSRADALLEEALGAATRQEWDAPPEHNVRDLLARGRVDFPADERFAAAQKRASLDVTMLAVKEREAGRSDEAGRLAQLALQLDASNDAASGILAGLAAPPALSATATATARPARPGGGRPPATAPVNPQVRGTPPEKGKGSSGDKGSAPTGGNWL
jgi:serine/threonine-protein kinase